MKHILMLLALFGSVFAADKNSAKDTKSETIPTFVSRSSLVLVPTVVTDKHGASITGLTKDDFTLFEDGHPQPIAVFEELNTSEPQLRVQDTKNGIYSNEIAQDSKEQRFTMIVFDLLNTRFEDQVRGRRDLLRFFESTLQRNEPIALSVLGPSGLSVITEFSTDPKTLAAALQRIRNQPTMRERSLALDGARERIEENVAQENRPSASLGRRMGESALLADTLDSRLDSFVLAQIDTMDAQDARRALSMTLLSMKEIGELFAGVSGRKTVIWVTGALPSMRLTMTDLGEGSDVQREYAAAWDALSRSQVAVYPMDMGGLFDAGFASPRFGRPPLRERMTMDDTASNLEHFAKMTGGKLCIYKMNIPDCYREAKADAAHYYLLGYYADFSKLKAGWRHLDVRLRRSDLRVRAREGFFVGTQQQKRGEREEMLTAIISPVNFTAVPLAVHVDPKGIHRKIGSGAKDPKMKEELAVIPFQFYVPGTSITIDRTNHNHIDISLAAFAKDNKGVIQGEFSKKIEGDLSERGIDDLRRQGILFMGEMTTPPGAYNMRFIVRDNTSSQMGSLNFSLDTAERETVANTPHP